MKKSFKIQMEMHEKSMKFWNNMMESEFKL